MKKNREIIITTNAESNMKNKGHSVTLFGKFNLVVIFISIPLGTRRTGDFEVAKFCRNLAPEGD